MIIKEANLGLITYLMRYGRITESEYQNCFRKSMSRNRKNIDKILKIPGIYKNYNCDTIFTLYYIISHRIPEFYDFQGKKILLKEVKNKSPISSELNCSSIEEIQKSFNL